MVQNTETVSTRGRSLTCKWCNRSFNKGEHLRRHVRSHTGAKPFVCKKCNRSFNRQDSLARHEKLHARDGSPKLPSPSVTDAVSSTPVNHDPHETLMNPTHFNANQTLDQLASAEIPQFDQSTEQDYSLIWPDSEELFQSILSFEDQWQSSAESLPFPISSSWTISETTAMPTPTVAHEPAEGTIPAGESQRAVHNVSRMVSNLTSTLTAAVEATSINSVFLDECLHMFWIKFAPTFPILHRATFVFRECTNPLLLNAIAIGSLYLGPKDAVAKGEALWRLAHTAVATSWQSLITHRGPYDTCDGVQLVIAALFAQLYGALSKNKSIRISSQAFRSLGLFWARQCSMLDTQPYSLDNLPSLQSSKVEKESQWRVWAAREIQQRALLGHYMLDGLLANISGEDTTVHHTANDLTLPSPSQIFDAVDANEWLIRMQAEKHVKVSFRHIFRDLFGPGDENAMIGCSISAFSHKVVLEGLQSLASACKDGETIGIPSRKEVERALARMYTCIDRSALLHADKLEANLRWHLICLDSAGDVAALCLTLCSQLGVQQKIWKSSRSGLLNIPEWTNKHDGRKALAHAVAIQEIVEQLPRGRAHAIHMPSSLFAAAMVYAAFTLAGTPSVRLPDRLNWQEVISNNPSTSTETGRFLRGEAARGASTTSRNLLYELNSMQKLFKCLSSQWGISHDMEEVIDELITMCH